ncbi:MAG: LysR family transcriptional regulator, partial [Pseudomonadota bacterium]
MIDRLRQMAIFAKTIDHGSFRGAARELRLSPSVVSHHISQLEEHLGVALIYRSTRKLTLTGEGQRLLAATRTMLEVVEGELSALSLSASEPSGELRITIPSVLSQSPFTDAIAAFSILYPRVRLSLDFSDSRRALIDGGFDIAIRMGIGGKTSATSRVLFSVKRRLVAATPYLAEKSAVREPEQLGDWDWIQLTPAQNVPLQFCRAGGEKVTIKPKAHMFSNDAQALYRLARAGAGLAVVPEFLATDDVAAGRVAYVLSDWDLPEISVFAVWPSNAPKNGLIRLMVDSLSR